MKELILQRKGQMFVPFDPESAELIKSYYENQPVRAKITGIKKPRSYRQLSAYWAACQKVAENCDDWPTKESVDFNIRVALDFRDPNKIAVRPDGQVQFYYRSIAFKNLEHAEAVQYFTRAFDLMAHKLGITTEELLANTGGKYA
jgi:hypothetical protein